MARWLIKNVSSASIQNGCTLKVTELNFPDFFTFESN